MHSGVETCVLIELSLGVVSRVGPGIGVLGESNLVSKITLFYPHILCINCITENGLRFT